MVSPKIAVFGCKNTTRYILSFLSKFANISHLITIDKEKGEKFRVADYEDLTSYAAQLDIPVYFTHKYSLKSDEDISHINSLGIDIAFVAGWQRLLPAEILNSLKFGAFGMHGSSMNLPIGRGRSPMNWSIIEGRRVFYTNLFRYDPGVDSGDVVDTFKFTITDRDTAETMHFKNTLAMKYLIQKNLASLVAGNHVFTKQKDITPTYYPKRAHTDSLIDWGMDVVDIDRHIRAVTRPFNGAYTYINHCKVVIYDAQMFDIHDFGYDTEPEGSIVEIFAGNRFLVKCFGGLLLVNEWEADDISVIASHNRFDNGPERIHYFPINKHGYFDIEETNDLSV